MKTIAQFFVLALLASCTNPKSDSVSSENTKTSTTESGLSKYADPIAGNWVSDKYLENIKKSKSVYSNKEYGTKVLFFNLNKDKLLTGSAILNGFSDHEGGMDVAITFDESKKEFLKSKDQKIADPTFKESFELKLNGQNKLDMYFPETKKTDVYQKLTTDLPTELRKILFAGSYTEKDSKSNVIFSADGKVNFKDYTSYDVVYDFATSPKFDAIVLHTSKTDGKTPNGDFYQYKILGNTVELQYMQSNDNDPSYKAVGKKIVLNKK